MGKRFHGLAPRQEEVLRQIAFGHDGSGCPPKMLATMERMGLIVGHDEQIYGPTNAPIDRIPMTVRRYDMPLAVHMEYCQWCSDNVEDE